jgi:hypothetical protein
MKNIFKLKGVLRFRSLLAHPRTTRYIWFPPQLEAHPYFSPTIESGCTITDAHRHLIKHIY